MTKYHYLICLFCVGLLIPALVQGQNKFKTKLVFDRDNKLQEIEFLGKDSKRIVKAIKVSSINPYASIPFPVVDKRNSIIYDIKSISSVDLSDWIPNLGLEEYPFEYLIESIRYSFNADSSLLLLLFQLGLYDNEGAFIGQGVSYVKMFQSDGSEWAPGFALPTYMGFPTLSEDGKSLGMAYGGIGHGRSFPQNCVIIETKTGVIQKQITLSNELILLRPFAVGNTIYFSADSFSKSGTQYHIFDTESRIIYDGFFAREKLRKLLRHEKNRMVFSSPTSNEEGEDFALNFSSETY